MSKSPDVMKTVTQAHFDRLTGATRDDWRKWEARNLVTKPGGQGYAWPHVLQALVLRRFERIAGLEAVVQCWEDVHKPLMSLIRPGVLDLVFDPGTSDQSRPRMRAFISNDDSTTAALCRAAVAPLVVDLGDSITLARSEFERVVHRAHEHADRPRGKQRGRTPREAQGG
jgi:hypothetical protein